ncbi:MAG: ISL3 family transposase [Planctomycetes bacterium]|nr:ISL3 family transposase [Planctomycetota bacterium]
MNDLETHYRLLLGLDSDWSVEGVDLSLEEQRVEIRLVHQGGELRCPECDAGCRCADHSPERTWRHLDTMQFETVLRARVPRSKCGKCGVKTIGVPWAGKSSRFTLMFEAFSIQVLLACSNVQRAARLLRLDWSSANRIMERAVERGLARRTVDDVEHVGVDEKSFLRGQSYVSVLTDLDGRRVLDVVEGRTEESADQLWRSMPTEQLANVKAVAMDMWRAYMNSAAKHVPPADVVHDKFHVAKHLNDAVDQVRRDENKVIKKEGDERLVGTKQLWLYRADNLPDGRVSQFESLKNTELKTAKAWAIKEQFRWFWTYFHSGYARNFFNQWYSWAVRCRLKPIAKKAKMLKRHLQGLLAYVMHRVTNAVSEGFNSKIQSIKANARGFRSFANYRIRILFFCGKLNLLPQETSH